MKNILRAYDPFLTKAISNNQNITTGNYWQSVIGIDGETVTFEGVSANELLEISEFFKLHFIKASNVLAGTDASNEPLKTDSIKEQFRKRAGNLETAFADYENNDYFRHWMKDDFKLTKYDVWASSKETRSIISAYGKSRKDKTKVWEVIADMSVLGILWADAALFHMKNNETVPAVKSAMKSQELFSILRAISSELEVHRINARKGGIAKDQKYYAPSRQELQESSKQFFEENPPSKRGTKKTFDYKAADEYPQYAFKTLAKWRKQAEK